MADYYDTLGIQRDADENEVRRAFRRLARKYHPDLNKDDKDAEAKFKEVNEAYEVLSNADSRKKYDAYGDQWRDADRIEEQRRASRTASGSPFDFTSRGYYDNSDLFSGFEDIFGAGGGYRDFETRRAPSTVRTETSVTVSLEEAYSGTTINANLTTGGRARRFEVEIPPGVDNGSAVRVTPESGTELLFRGVGDTASALQETGRGHLHGRSRGVRGGDAGRRGGSNDAGRSADSGHHSREQPERAEHPPARAGDAGAGVARGEGGPVRDGEAGDAQESDGGAAGVDKAVSGIESGK